MSIAKIQTGDKVRVIAGNYKGVEGVVTKVSAATARNGLVKRRAAVSNVSKILKFRKSQYFQGQKYAGQQFEVDRTIDISNLMLITENKVSKSKIETTNGKKTRVYKLNSKPVLKESLPKVEKVKKTELEAVS
jgi:ribosomal protein L24